MDVSPNFEINFFVQIIAILFVMLLPANVTAFFIVIVGYIEAQMLALSEELTNVMKDAVEHYKRNRDDETRIINVYEERKIINAYVRKHLEDIIRIHTTNLNLLRQAEHIFGKPVTIEFTVIIISLTAELLGGLENTWLQMPYTLMMVAINCLIGQRVMDASITFEQATYNCEWETFDVTNRKIVLLMLQNSQKTMKLSAGGITTLSLESFMSFIKFIYSAYNTLRSTVQ